MHCIHACMYKTILNSVRFKISEWQSWTLTSCSLNLTTNSEYSQFFLINWVEQNFFLLLFHQKQSDRFKNSWKFRMHRFGIGCWIRWRARYEIQIEINYSKDSIIRPDCSRLLGFQKRWYWLFHRDFFQKTRTFNRDS